MRFDHFGRKSSQQAFSVTGSHTPEDDDSVVFDPFPEKPVFKIIVIPLTTKEVTGSIEKISRKLGFHNLVYLDEISVE